MRAYKRKRYADPRVRLQVLAANRKSRSGVTPTRPEPTTCEICGGPPGRRALNLDHCHKTKKFRGWLCGKCNTTLGKAGDDLDGLTAWFEKATAYLRRSLEH